ncbi:hypothetical protein [Candidatus Tisiphia endosymbiont of Oplodontha viridula]|uniref:hypothetical protein n=1 Tax=Candidatus Tisiphia endosymbiont of Oplodontha viridula TaxID=3077925 RepID=UPI0035C8A3B5
MPRVLKKTVKKVGTSATTDVDVTREISTIGDSTDGEDYELPENVLQSKKHNIVAKLNKYQYKHDYKYKDATTNRLTPGSTDIKVSCMLKEIGNQLLQHETVRTKYKDIKSQLISSEQTRYNTLDELLGRGWGLIVKCYDTKDNQMSEAAADYYFKINKERIQATCNNDVNYQSLNSNAEKGEYYLKYKVKIQKRFEEIYKLNKALDIQKQRENTEYLPISEQVDASSFLAAVKASKKLDKDLGKNHLCDNNHGTGSLISTTSITRETTQQNETLEISTGGAFKHFKTNEGTYETIGQQLKRLIDEEFINKNILKQFFQFSLKGKECSEIVMQDTTKTLQWDTTKANLIDQLKAHVELMFGIEVKRNPAALLTNAMFFDLVDKGIYKVEEMVDKLSKDKKTIVSTGKMPMAIKGAVPASVIIDIQMGESTYDYRYDYEDAPKGYKEVRNLASKDEAILHDWLKYKLQETLDEKVKNIQSDPTIQELTNCFQNLNMDVIGLNRKQLKENEHMVLNSNDNKFSGGKIQWSKNKSHIKCTLDKVNKIEAKVFYNLIKDWYGIELSCLNKDDFILLKAAAEPQDPTLDRDDYQGSFKLPATDTASEGAVSKMKLLDYKQKYVLNHSKLKDSVDKMSSNKMITTKLHEVDEEINQALHKHLTAEELMSTLGKLLGLTNKYKSSDEIMSCLKAIHLGLKSSEKAICTNRLNLKDPNKHFMEGNKLSIDDLFNGVLDRVNETAIENNRQDILTTLQEHYYDLQEQVNIVGNTGI